MVKCPRCGYENDSESLYCAKCTYLLKDPENNVKTTMKKRNNSWNMSIGKKIIVVIGIIVIAFLLFSFVYEHSQPSKNDTLNVVSDDGSNLQSSAYPYKAKIIYDSSWYSKMGDPNYLVSKSGWQTQSFTLDCASWDKVSVFAQKEDYGEGNLTVQILRDGEIVAENTTSEVFGSVSIEYN